MEMDENSYLNPVYIKNQGNKAISCLNQDSAAIDIVDTNLNTFIEDSEISSEGFNALKLQIADYKTVLRAMKTANASDVCDFTTLNGAVGDEVLDGKNILTQMKIASSEKTSDVATAESFEKKKSNAKWFGEELYYGWKASHYWSLADIDQKIYDKWLAKKERFEEIEASTCSLFTGCGDIRNVAKAALASITGCFQNGVYNYDPDASWRTDLGNSYYDRMIEVGEDGSITPKWTEVEKIMRKDADDITPEEYHVLAVLYMNMNEEDMAKFLGCCMKGEDVDEPWTVELQGTKDYSKWTVDETKINNLIGILSSEVDERLVLLRNQDRLSLEYDENNIIRNELIQKMTLLQVTKQIGEFHGDFGATEPRISIKKDDSLALTVDIQQFRNISSPYSPIFSNQGNSHFTIHYTDNGLNIIDNGLKDTEVDMYTHFGCKPTSQQLGQFLYDETKDQVIDTGTDALEKYVTKKAAEKASEKITDEIAKKAAEETAEKVVGKAFNYIPFVGDTIGLVVDVEKDKIESEKNAGFIRQEFNTLNVSSIYSAFDCCSSRVDYDLADSTLPKVSMYIYEGDDTSSIVNNVNNALGTDFSVEDVLNNAGDVWTKKEEIIADDITKGAKYNNAVRID